MPSPRVATKLHLPKPAARPGHPPSGWRRGLRSVGPSPGWTLISAPTGFGKTSLVAQWLSSRGRPTAPLRGLHSTG